MELPILNGLPPTGISLVYALSTPGRKIGFKKGCIYQKSKGRMSQLMYIPERAGNWPG
jgi:hypothetical protein